MKVEDQTLAMPSAEKAEEVWQSENDFRTGFLAVSQPPTPAERGRQETARFPRASSTCRADPRCLPSHTFCVGTLDLASVSTSVRSVSNSVRRTHPPVSANLRRKPPLIARRAGYDCAPLQLRAMRSSIGIARRMRSMAFLVGRSRTPTALSWAMQGLCPASFRIIHSDLTLR